jgi:hypothetical protein
MQDLRHSVPVADFQAQLNRRSPGFLSGLDRTAAGFRIAPYAPVLSDEGSERAVRLQALTAVPAHSPPRLGGVSTVSRNAVSSRLGDNLKGAKTPIRHAATA